MNILVIGNGFDLAHGLPKKICRYILVIIIATSKNEFMTF